MAAKQGARRHQSKEPKVNSEIKLKVIKKTLFLEKKKIK